MSTPGERRTCPTRPVVASCPWPGATACCFNLSGAHAPFFTRNLVILTDSAGRTGVGEVPAARRSARRLEDTRDLLIGQSREHLRLL